MITVKQLESEIAASASDLQSLYHASRKGADPKEVTEYGLQIAARLSLMLLSFKQQKEA